MSPRVELVTNKLKYVSEYDNIKILSSGKVGLILKETFKKKTKPGEQFFIIPRGIGGDFKIYIEAYEAVHDKTKIVVCSTTGKRLKPYAIDKNGTITARFWVLNSFMRVVRNFNDRTISIEKFSARRNFDEGLIRVKYNVMWTGSFNKNIPLHLIGLKDAVIASGEKTQPPLYVKR
ncbi:MAG: hypothetical protein ACTSRA_00620 [Promethearchaeota archaeon]|nr:MAG: hypothetical protein [Helarchaeota virus Nidhogg Meg22_1012]URC17461.1 MAG: hypothetical protein [Helarchaeota virus Nidhogg Meg22_1214]